MKLEDLTNLKYSLLNLFPTPVYIAEAEGNTLDNIQDEMMLVYGDLMERGFFQVKEGWNTHKLSDPSFTGNLFQHYDFRYFLEFLDKHLQSYLFRHGVVGEQEFIVNESWMTLTQHKDYAHIHNHGMSNISGCYYIQTNGNDGDFTIPCTQKPLEMQAKIFPNLAKRLTIPPKVGRLILFPGWMDHGIKTNTTESDRVSISFNISVKDKEKNVVDCYAR